MLAARNKNTHVLILKPKVILGKTRNGSYVIYFHAFQHIINFICYETNVKIVLSGSNQYHAIIVFIIYLPDLVSISLCKCNLLVV